MAVINAGGGRIAPAPKKSVHPKIPTEPNRLHFACVLFGGTAQYDISQFVISATWTDSFDAPAQQMDIQFASPRIDDPTSSNPAKTTSLRQLVKVGMGIRCFADAYKENGQIVPMSRLSGGAYKTEFFRGYIFGKSVDGSPNQDQVSLTCYDQMIYLAKNDLDAIYKNTSATAIIRDLCDKSGLPMADEGQDFQDTTVKIKRLVSYGNSLYDVAYLALQKTWMLTGGMPDGTGGQRFRLRSDAGLVTLRERLQPKHNWFLVPNDTVKNGQTIPGNITSATRSISIENMQTGFDIRHTGTQGRRQFGGSYADPVIERLYGRMRKTVDVPKFDSADIKKVMAQQKALIGIPDVQIAVGIPLTHGIRAGDQVTVQENADTGIRGKWYVSAVTHDISSTTGSTTMTLVKTVHEADVVDKSSIEVPISTSTASYSREKDGSGKYIKFSGKVKVVDFTATKINGKTYEGNEMAVLVSKSMDVKVGAQVEVHSGTHNRRCQMVDNFTDGTYDIELNKVVADELGVKTGDKVDIYPLTVKKPASASSSSSTYDGGNTSGGFNLDVVSNILTVARRYGADAAAMVATAMVENNLQYSGTGGDGNTSFGPFQMHKGGALGSHSRAWAESSDTGPSSMFANRAQAFAAIGARDGAGAARVQIPADPAGYAVAVDKNLPAARNLIAQIN